MPLAIERREIVHDLQAAVGDELLDQRLTAKRATCVRIVVLL